MENESKPPSMIQEMRQTFGMMHLICAAICAPVAAMTSRPGTIGSRFMGLPMALGLVAMLVTLVLVPVQRGEMVPRGEQIAGLVGFFALCLVVHRVTMRLKRGAGFVPHSMYSGTPLVPGDELAAKGVVIPAVLLFAGMVVIIPMTGVGMWLCLASVSTAVCTEFYKRGVAAQVRAMNDARIEHEVVVEKYREGQHR